MNAMHLAKKLYKYLNKSEDKHLKTLWIDQLTKQQLFLEMKDGSRFQIIVIPTEVKI